LTVFGFTVDIPLYRRNKRQLEEFLNLVECNGRLKRPLLAVPGYIYSYYLRNREKQQS
jgi:hypothetical protein